MINIGDRSIKNGIQPWEFKKLTNKGRPNNLVRAATKN